MTFPVTPVAVNICMKRRAQLVVKRLADIAIASLSLALVSPLLPLLVLLIRLESPGPVIFRQLRSGRNGVPFHMFKFRSMYQGVPHLRNADGSAYVGRNDSRVSRVGRWLREFSLDELPQLFNVLAGEMSIIGPRPEKPDYTEELPSWALEKLQFRPGCLSLPLIHGRNDLPWVERNKLDVFYVRNYTLWLDLRILVKGLWSMFVTRAGVYCSAERSADAIVPQIHEKKVEAVVSQSFTKEQNN
jgi:lipopolysaccharide/colanic/teichoic acid biosynthesis glycosyltransferase